MERKFVTCDRCSASGMPQGNAEIVLQLQDPSSGESKLVEADLCLDCHDGLIKWFGEHNPRTGLLFTKA